MTGVCGIIGLTISGAISNPDQPTPSDDSPCIAVVRDVSNAVEAGIDEPAHLNQFRQPGCAMDPIAVAKDIEQD